MRRELDPEMQAILDAYKSTLDAKVEICRLIPAPFAQRLASLLGKLSADDIGKVLTFGEGLAEWDG